MSRLINLTFSEYAAGRLFAMQRKLQAQRGSWNTQVRYTSSSWEQEERELRGVLAELAFAKLLGLYWVADVNVFHEHADVNGIDVRSTEYRTGYLPLRDRDHDDRYAVLLTERNMAFTYCGAILVADGKAVVDPVADPDDADKLLWKVPQAALDDSVETLRKLRVLALEEARRRLRESLAR